MPLYGLPKDHKPPNSRDGGVIGHPLRPVCGATESRNGPLSDVIAEILTVHGDSMDKSVNTQCLSTEEMCHCLQSFNQTVEEGGTTDNVYKPVIFSMNVVAMYPSLDVSVVAKAIGEEFGNSDLEINVDERELALYLTVIFQKEWRKELVARQLHEIIPKRKQQTTRRILMSAEEIIDRSEKTISKFQEIGLRDPDTREVRQMIGLALEEAVKTTMQNHVYKLNGIVRRQAEGGAIGNKLTGAMAKVFMSRWTKEFRERVLNATKNTDGFAFHALKYYVDDNNVVMEAIPPGYKLIGDELVLVQDDERTAKLAQKIANNICEFIKMEVDYPSRHPSGWMPLLDLQVRSAQNNTFDFMFYQKLMASPFTILNRAAMPTKVKWENNVQQGIRRLRNTRLRLQEEVRSTLLEEWGESMMVSGYPKEYRKKAIQSAVVGYEKMVEKCHRGIKPLYRPREWQEAERRVKKKISKTAWFRPHDTV